MTQPLDTSQQGPLQLHPFRGMRYDPDLVGDVGDVTSPPYDVMDRAMIDDLLNQHPRNIVRLILPRVVSDPATGGDPYARAASRLERWRSRGILTTDPEPALYLYEYGNEATTVCGLVGALALASRQQRIVLPHEDVMAGVVADRFALLSATEANLEPILLVYDGGGSTSALLDRIRTTTPLTEVRAADATVHRLWSISDPADLDSVRLALAPHQALIADGHHRYATYQQLQRHHGGDGPGPWDRGLALLVDQSECPLTLGAIHRSVAEVSLASLSAPPGYTLSESGPVDSQQPPPPAGGGHLVLTDGVASRVLQRLDDGALPTTEPASDAERLRDIILPCWGVSADRVGFHHTVEQAVGTAQQDDGVAVLLHPASVAEVMAVARAGKTMPRKSTSFGPKPRMGLIMRSLLDEV